MSAEVRFTRVKKHGGALLSKRIFLDDNGEVQSDGAPCAMGKGSARRVCLNGTPARDFAAHILDLGSHEALISGDLADGLPDKIRIEKDELAEPAQGTHGRTRKTFVYRAGHPAPALLDFDQKAMPDDVAQLLAATGGFEGALASLLPDYDRLTRVVRASTSAGLCNAVTGDRYAGSGGVHVYVFAADGTDIPRFLETLQKRAWLAGFGWIMVGKRGQLLIRSIVDASVGLPERLMFEGPPLVAHPLTQDHAARRPAAYEGRLLDTRAACPPLTADEQRRFEELVAAAKQAAKPEVTIAIERAAEEIAQDRGIDLGTARSVIQSSLKGDLTSHDTLHFDDDDLGLVSVAEVLADPARFDGRTLADPLEGRAYGRGKAKVFWNANGTAIINSFAHGGTVYHLRHDAAFIESKLEEAGEGAPYVFAGLMPHVHDIDPVTRERLRNLTAKLGKVGKRTVDKTLDEAMQRAREARRADQSMRSSNEDKRDDYGSFSSLAVEDFPEPPADDWKKKLSAAIAEMNSRYFVSTLGGRTVIASLVHDEALHRERLVLSRKEDVRLLYNHRHYMTGYTKKSGAEIWKDLGTAWIEHPGRRTFDRIALIPSGPVPEGTFNLWRGFGVEPRAGRWPTIDNHLREIVCAGNAEHYAWLMGWLAYCVQRPGRQAEVAVVLRGLKGTGKGMVGQMLMRVFRNHALHITHSRHLVGNFNSHLTDALLLFLDEAYWGGDKQGEGVLKALITEPTLMIEPKGIDAFTMPNRLKILMASNAEWVVPASADERRYFVLDVSDRRRGDTAYFARLNAAIEGDELAAMLHDLLECDLAGWNHRTAPHTAGLNDQKLITGDSVTRFWLDCLHAGGIVGAAPNHWPPTISVSELHAAYINFAHDHGDRHPTTREQMARKLRKLCPWLETFRPRGENDGARPRQYKFRTLEEHRTSFLAAMNIEPDSYDWRDSDHGE